ncbi:hypothetical protein [Haloferula sp.]|uniref:hypothetical protein n=1 Tax=Haloferula sp. TaxID=2497595 RepID=UPI00329E6CE2
MKPLLIACMILGAAHLAPCEAVRWEFDDLVGWKNGSQAGSPQSYSVDSGKLRISTRANTRDRVKVARKERYQAGIFTWRIYVPAMGAGDQASIGAFLYADDKREFDFEIGYGKAELRKQLKAKKTDMVCYCTTQGLPFSSSQFLVKAEAWHTFAISLEETERGTYDLAWSIDGKVVKKVPSRIKSSVDFSLLCSMENLTFMGDHIPKENNHALFDWVEYTFPPSNAK